MGSLRLALPLASILLAPAAFGSFFCSSESKHGGIQYEDASKVAWELLDLTFEQSPVAESYLSCTRFLESIPKSWNESVKLLPLYPVEKRVARLGLSDPLIELCVKTEGCRINPIYGIFRPGKWLESYRKPALTDALPQCSKKPFRSEDALDEEGSEVRLEPADLEIGKVTSLPEANLEEHLIHSLETKKPKRVFLSTMILSLHILEAVDQWALKNPKTEIWAFFSHNIQALETGFPSAYQPKAPNLRLFPVFKTPDADDSYHIKGLAYEGTEKSVEILSVNLRRFREEKVADRVIELKGENAYSSFVSILDSVLDQQCSNLRYLDCSNQLRFGLDSERSKKVKGWIQNACAHRFTPPKPLRPVLYRGGGTSLEEQLVDWISSAKKTIEVSSHILKNTRIFQALESAAEKGVKVQILAGTDLHSKGGRNITASELPITLQTREMGVTSHAKFILIDRELAVWGTGNFTKTGLSNPWEIFLATRNQAFLSVLSSYLAEYQSNR